MTSEGTTTLTGLDARIEVSRGAGFGLRLDVRIEPGATAALLGPNGAGKSTAVAALCGILPLEAGHIMLGGRVLDEPRRGVFVPPEERRVGVVFQDYLLFPHLSVADNVAFGLRSRGLDRDVVGARVDHWLGRLGLAALAARSPRDLSGGQAQRVALARALVTEPDLLLLDEPLAAGDVSTRAELRRILAEHLDDFAGPRLLITHEPIEAFLLADTVHVVEHGAVTQSGRPDDIRVRPRTRYAADLAGANLVSGTAEGGVVSAAGHDLVVGDTSLVGPVLATIHPRSISLHRRAPEGSPRNTWSTSVARMEHYGDRVRIQTGDPLPLTAEITPGAVDALSLEVGSLIWLSIKATEIGVEPA